MGKADTKDLLKFLAPFSDQIRGIVLWLREFVWDLYPDANELIYDNYNALAFGWSLSDKAGDTFCSIAVWSNKYVHFGFYRGSEISDPEKMLMGNGKQYRYIKVHTKRGFPRVYIKQLLKEAYAVSLARMKPAARAHRDKAPILKGATIIKLILTVKKRPGMVLPQKK